VSSPDLDRWVPEIPWLGVVLVALESGAVVRANSAFFELIGHEEEEVLSGRLTIHRMLTEDSLAKVREAISALKRNGKSQPIEGDYTHRDGSLRHVWLTGALLGEHPGLGVAYILDQTLQRKTMEALRESEERARRFAQASFEGLFLHDKAVILDVNELLPAMFGTTREAMIGRHAMEFTDPSCHPLMLRNVARQYDFPYELLGKRRDGTTFPVEVLGKPLPVDGQVLRVTAVRDISERKRTEAALREAEAALLQTQKFDSLGLLAGGIAHDFNNLLAIIASHVTIAHQQLAVEADPGGALVEVERAVARAAELCRQMLVYSGRSPKQIVQLQINDLVAEMHGLLTAPFSKKIQFRLELCADCPLIQADQAQVEQVLLNLLTNAAEAIGEARGTIVLRTSFLEAAEGQLPSVDPGQSLPAGLYAVVEVTDSGAGMDAPTLARIFDPFFSTKQRGRGLGLSAMQGILRGHQGGLRISSVLGQGTTFELFFPALEGDRRQPEATPPAPSSAREPRRAQVLVVDDERALRQAIRHLLEAEGHTVLEAANGVEALQLFRQRQDEIDLVLLDLLMPEMDGGEALVALRAIDADVPIILSSGFDATETLDRARGEVSGVLSKPFRASELLRVVQAALARPGLEGDLAGEGAGHVEVRAVHGALLLASEPLGDAQDRGGDLRGGPGAPQAVQRQVVGPGVVRELAARVGLAQLQEALVHRGHGGHVWRRRRHHQGAPVAPRVLPQGPLVGQVERRVHPLEQVVLGGLEAHQAGGALEGLLRVEAQVEQAAAELVEARQPRPQVREGEQRLRGAADRRGVAVALGQQADGLGEALGLLVQLVALLGGAADQRRGELGGLVFFPEAVELHPPLEGLERLLRREPALEQPRDDVVAPPGDARQGAAELRGVVRELLEGGVGLIEALQEVVDGFPLKAADFFVERMPDALPPGGEREEKGGVLAGDAGGAGLVPLELLLELRRELCPLERAHQGEQVGAGPFLLPEPGGAGGGPVHIAAQVRLQGAEPLQVPRRHREGPVELDLVLLLQHADGLRQGRQVGVDGLDEAPGEERLVARDPRRPLPLVDLPQQREHLLAFHRAPPWLAARGNLAHPVPRR
jgi:two-component system cell cycle sensor histidine kinase/response regulator CckA